jgi:hypothetical protein
MFSVAFFNRYLLWGLFGAAIPILIHLFHRRRFRTVAWAAMEFLVSSSKLTARRLKVMQAILLLTRMGIVSLLALGVARPYFTGEFFGGALARSKSSAVFILDNSYSMGLKEGEKTSFDVAKEVTAKIVSAFARGDSLTYVLMAEQPTVVTEGNPLPEKVKKLIENSELSDETTDILASLTKGLEILDSEKNTRKELFLITDCQKNAWDAANREGWRKLDQLLARAKVKPRIFVVDVSRRAGENVTAAWAELPSFPCGVGKRYMVEVGAITSAEKPAARPIFTLFLDDEKKEVARAEGSEFKNLGSTGRLIFSVDSPGFHWGRVAVQTDCLQTDNSRYFSFEARRSVRILCVDGVGSEDRFESGIGYLAYAFAPEKGLEGIEAASNILDPNVVSLRKSVEEELARYDIVALYNVPGISPRMYEELSNFVRSSGGLMIFLGDKVDPVEYAARYASSEKSFLPCAIGSAKGAVPTGDAKEVAEVYRISEVDFGHRAMAAFKDAAGGDLTTAKFYRFFSLEPDKGDPDVRVLARFSDGSPYLVEKKFGRGRTILFASSCDLKWSNIALRPAFLPLLHRLAYHLASGFGERYNLTVGDKIVQSVRPEAATSPASITDPAGQSFKVIVKKDGAGGSEPTVVFEDTTRAGIYALRTTESSARDANSAGETVRYFAVNVDTAESDLSVLDEKAIRRQVPWEELKYLRGEGAAEAIERIRHGKEIWRFLIVGTICLLLLESLLARKIDKG